MKSSGELEIHPARRLGLVLLSNVRIHTYARGCDVGFHLLDSNYPLTQHDGETLGFTA